MLPILHHNCVIQDQQDAINEAKAQDIEVGGTVLSSMDCIILPMAQAYEQTMRKYYFDLLKSVTAAKQQLCPPTDHVAHDMLPIRPLDSLPPAYANRAHATCRR